MIPSFITMRNTFGDPLPTSHFICMVIFLLVSAVLQAFGLGAWRYIGRVGSVLTLITFVTIVAVTCGEAGGVGP